MAAIMNQRFKMPNKTGTNPKKELPKIINLPLDHLKTTINYKAIPKDKADKEK